MQIRDPEPYSGRGADAGDGDGVGVIEGLAVAVLGNGLDVAPCPAYRSSRPRVKQRNEFARHLNYLGPSRVSEDPLVVERCDWRRGHSINVGSEPITKSTKRTKLLKMQIRYVRPGCNKPINIVVVKDMGDFFGKRGNCKRINPRPKPLQFARIGNRANFTDKLAAPDLVISHVASITLPTSHGRNT